MKMCESWRRRTFVMGVFMLGFVITHSMMMMMRADSGGRMDNDEDEDEDEDEDDDDDDDVMFHAHSMVCDAHRSLMA